MIQSPENKRLLLAYSVEKLLTKNGPHEIIVFVDFMDGALSNDGQRHSASLL